MCLTVFLVLLNADTVFGTGFVRVFVLLCCGWYNVVIQYLLFGTCNTTYRPRPFGRNYSSGLT